MKKTNKLLLSLALAFSFLSFTTFNTNEVKYEMSSPTDKKIYNLGDTIFIKGKVSANDHLHNVNIKITRDDNQTELFFKNIHTHSNSENINLYYINYLKENVGLTVKISTSGHDGIENSSKTIKVSTKYKAKKNKEKAKKKTK